MFPLDLHVVWREGNEGRILRGVEAVFLIFLLWSSQDLGYKDLSIRLELPSDLLMLTLIASGARKG